MNTVIDKQKPRPIEVRFRVVEDQHLSLERAESYNRSVCDFFAIVQGYRDVPENGDGTEVVSLVAASRDGATEQPLDVDTLYNVWLSVAGLIVQSDDETPEAMKIRRFVSMVLNRVQLDENLQRLEALKATHPDVPERELVTQMIGEPARPSTV